MKIGTFLLSIVTGFVTYEKRADSSVEEAFERYLSELDEQKSFWSIKQKFQIDKKIMGKINKTFFQFFHPL